MDLGVSYGRLVFLRCFQASGLAFLFIPINTIAYIGVKQSENNDVSGLTNLARNIGGSCGTAFIATMLTRRTAAHESNMVRNLTTGNPAFMNQVAKLKGMFGGHSSGNPLTGAGSHAAQAYIYNQLHRQAAMLAYLDIIQYLSHLLRLHDPAALLHPPPAEARRPLRRPLDERASVILRQDHFMLKTVANGDALRIQIRPRIDWRIGFNFLILAIWGAYLFSPWHGFENRTTIHQSASRGTATMVLVFLAFLMILYITVRSLFYFEIVTVTPDALRIQGRLLSFTLSDKQYENSRHLKPAIRRMGRQTIRTPKRHSLPLQRSDHYVRPPGRPLRFMGSYRPRSRGIPFKIPPPAGSPAITPW